MSDDAIERLTAWLTAGGARLAVAIQPVSDRERGACARAPIAVDDVVLRIPARFLITDELAQASAIGRKIAASGVKLASTHSLLAAFVLQERRDPGSFWKPYLDILPRAYPHMPVYYNKNERFFLNGSYVLRLIDYRWHSYMTDYKALVEHVPGFDEITSQDFVWGRLTIATRLFGVSVGGEKARALVPMADMLNHHWPQETTWSYDERAAAFVLTALRAFAPGDPVRNAYGKRSNGHFLVNYGFVLDENEDNEAQLRLSVPEGDPLLDVKAAALEPGGGATRTFQVAVGYKLDDVRKMFSFLRFAHANAEELAQLTTPDGFDVAGIAPVSARNEEAALRALGVAAKASLAAFDTTAEQDTAMLAKLPLSPNMKSCVILRRGEKRVLRHYADLALIAAPLLHLSRPELARFLASRPDIAASGDLAPYLEQVVTPLAERRTAGSVTAR